MNDRELEVEALLAGDLVHDVDHPGEARIRSRGTGRADDQRDAGLDRTRHHDLGVALDRCRGEHAGAGGKRTGTGVGAAGVAADHPGAERDRLVERVRGEIPNPAYPSPKPAETMPSPRSLIAVHVEDIACPTVAKPR